MDFFGLPLGVFNEILMWVYSPGSDLFGKKADIRSLLRFAQTCRGLQKWIFGIQNDDFFRVLVQIELASLLNPCEQVSLTSPAVGDSWAEFFLRRKRLGYELPGLLCRDANQGNNYCVSIDSNDFLLFVGSLDFRVRAFHIPNGNFLVPAPQYEILHTGGTTRSLRWIPNKSCLLIGTFGCILEYFILSNKFPQLQTKIGSGVIIGEVKKMIFTDQTLYAVADRQLTIWNLEDWMLIETLEYRGDVWGLCQTPDYVLTGDSGGYLGIIDKVSNQFLTRLGLGVDLVHSISYISGFVFCGLSSGELSIWKLDKISELAHATNAPDPKKGTRDQLTDYFKPAQLQVIEKYHKSSIQQCDIYQNYLVTCSADSTVQFSDLRKFLKAEFRLDKTQGFTINHNSSWINCFHFIGDSFVTAGGDNATKLWKVPREPIDILYHKPFEYIFYCDWVYFLNGNKWTQYWAVLSDGVLNLFTNRPVANSKPVHSILLLSCRAKESDKRAHCIEIKVQNKSYYLAATGKNSLDIFYSILFDIGSITDFLQLDQNVTERKLLTQLKDPQFRESLTTAVLTKEQAELLRDLPPTGILPVLRRSVPSTDILSYQFGSVLLSPQETLQKLNSTSYSLFFKGQDGLTWFVDELEAQVFQRDEEFLHGLLEFFQKALDNYNDLKQMLLDEQLHSLLYPLYFKSLQRQTMKVFWTLSQFLTVLKLEEILLTLSAFAKLPAFYPFLSLLEQDIEVETIDYILKSLVFFASHKTLKDREVFFQSLSNLEMDNIIQKLEKKHPTLISEFSRDWNKLKSELFDKNVLNQSGHYENLKPFTIDLLQVQTKPTKTDFVVDSDSSSYAYEYHLQNSYTKTDNNIDLQKVYRYTEGSSSISYDDDQGYQIYEMKKDLPEKKTTKEEKPETQEASRQLKTTMSSLLSGKKAPKSDSNNNNPPLNETLTVTFPPVTKGKAKFKKDFRNTINNPLALFQGPEPVDLEISENKLLIKPLKKKGENINLAISQILSIEKPLHTAVGKKEFPLTIISNLGVPKNTETILIFPNFQEANDWYQSLMLARSECMDWNKAYQDIIEDESSTLTYKTEKLGWLLDQFREVSQILVQVLVEQKSEPNPVIPPLNEACGIAGGTKFCSHNIFFKFSSAESSTLYLNDYYASKAAAHELKGLQALNVFQIEKTRFPIKVNFPLLVVIDWKGYRVSCESLLPIKRESIVYGSADGGMSIHATKPEFNVLMRRAAKFLNIKEHTCFDARGTPTLLAMPADIEGHHRDDRYYLLDTARVFPPTLPVKGVKSSHLVYLFRPEFLKESLFPLCSDAYIGFGRDPTNPHVLATHNQEIREATEYLTTQVVYKFLVETCLYFSNLTLTTEKVIGVGFLTPNVVKRDTFRRFIVDLHSSGINIRFLGKLAECFTSKTSPVKAIKARSETQEAVQHLILMEILARTLKNFWRDLIRNGKQSLEKTTGIFVYQFFIETCWEEVFEKAGKIFCTGGEDNLNFGIFTKHQKELTPILFERFSFLIGLSWNQPINTVLQMSSTEKIEAAIEKVSPRHKTLFFIQYYRGIDIERKIDQAVSSKGKIKVNKALCLQGEEEFLLACERNPGHALSLAHQAYMVARSVVEEVDFRAKDKDCSPPEFALLSGSSFHIPPLYAEAHYRRFLADHLFKKALASSLNDVSAAYIYVKYSWFLLDLVHDFWEAASMLSKARGLLPAVPSLQQEYDTLLQRIPTCSDLVK